ncbi:hypothetical protein [Nocardia sp. CC227C]|uniref:hypothetical protein n=1 Tax=Nocardia sp. CC227C TaxID=3044562 RepID=UPI00278C0581|nr:hypothetical protein [Nocardia sp. CC227C]
MTDTSPASYDRSILLGAYLDAVAEYSKLERKTGMEAEDAYVGWSPDAVVRSKSRLAFLADLERLFGVDLGLPTPRFSSNDSRQRVRLTFLHQTAQSYHAIATPFSGYMEAGGLVNAMEDVGVAAAVLDSCDRMQVPVETLRQQHLELLDTVLRGLLGERADAVYAHDDPAATHIVVPDPWDPWD